MALSASGVSIFLNALQPARTPEKIQPSVVLTASALLTIREADNSTYKNNLELARQLASER